MEYCKASLRSPMASLRVIFRAAWMKSRHALMWSSEQSICKDKGQPFALLVSFKSTGSRANSTPGFVCRAKKCLKLSLLSDQRLKLILHLDRAVTHQQVSPWNCSEPLDRAFEFRRARARMRARPGAHAPPNGLAGCSLPTGWPAFHC